MRVLAVLLCSLSIASIAPFSPSPLGAEQLDSGSAAPPWVISSGAFTGLPPGSLTAVAVGIERGIDALKLDLVLSSDDQVMVLPSPRLEDATNVALLYPERAREDGSFYSVDFSGAELKSLALSPTAGQPIDRDRSSAVFTPRFPVISLAEVLGYIDLITAGSASSPLIICELREGWLHRRDEKNLAAAVYALLRTYRADSGRPAPRIASYDPDELQELADVIARDNSGVPLIQLIGSNDGAEVQSLEFGRYQPYNYDLMFTRFGLKATAGYAAAIGLTPEVLFAETGGVTLPGYLADAQTLGIPLIVYGEAADIPLNTALEASGLLEQLFTTLGFSGVLSDDIELLEKWRQQHMAAAGSEDENTVERLIKQLEDGSIQPRAADQPSDRNSAVE